MGKEPAPHACRPNSMDLNDAAYMRDEAKQAFNMRKKEHHHRFRRHRRHVLMRRKPGMLPHEKITPHLPREQCRPRKRTRRRRLPEHHGMPSPLENILTTIFTPDIVSGTRGNNEGNRRGKH